MSKPKGPDERMRRLIEYIKPEDDVRKLLEKIQVVSDEEAEQAEMVVCLPDNGERFFPDDVTANCAFCGIQIHHRPHVPKKPPKVCIHCAQKLMDKDQKMDA
jgi:hypothetical protein